MHKIVMGMYLGVLAAACGAAMPAGAVADPITPAKTAYHVESTEHARAKVCQLILDFADPPDPVVVEFAIVVGWDKTQNLAVTAFTVAVLDVQGQGKAKPPRFTRLASVGFSAAKFNSAGLLQQQSDDRSVWVWTDHEQTLALLEAFADGDFSIVFASEKDRKLRTYRIAQGPPEAIERQFGDCIATLGPKVAERDGDHSSDADVMARAKRPVATLERILPRGAERPNEAASRRMMETAPARERPLP